MGRDGTAANLRLLFCGRKFLMLLKRLTVGQAVPEVPLSVGQISIYFPVHSHICPRMHIAVYIILYQLLYDRGTEGFAL